MRIDGRYPRAGPTVGDPFPPGVDAPVAVVKEYFDKVCPDPTIIDSDIVTRNLPNDASAQAVLDAWVDKLHELDDHPCIEFDQQSAQIFTIWCAVSVPHEQPVLTNLKDIWFETCT